MSTGELLKLLLNSGWEWTKCNEPGYMLLSKGTFKWHLSHDYDMYNLIEMLLRRGDDEVRDKA
jgi:hypothetical protein